MMKAEENVCVGQVAKCVGNRACLRERLEGMWTQEEEWGELVLV